jgi:CelD/BcsL family acetyltransferase involved in cellulose biosynthesis
VETEEDLKEGFEILLMLHSVRWGKGKKSLGVFADDKFRTFHEMISRNLLARKQLRLAWLECGGKPIAIEYQFFDSRTVYAYQAGIDLSVNDEYSPGKLTMMAAIRYAIEHGHETFDLLRGDEPYKSNWRAVSFPCYDLRLWPRRGLGCMEWAMWKGYSLVTRLLKPIIPQAIIHRGLTLFRAMRG